MSTVWRCIERLHGGSAVSASWRKQLGPDFDRVKPFLSATGNEATSFPSANICECWLGVVRHGPEDIVGVSDCGTSGCDDVSLTAADVALYEFNVKKFSRAVASALQFEWRDKALGIYGARQIGAFGAASMPIIFAVQREQQVFSDVLRQIVLHAGKNFVVLSPTARFWDATSSGLLAQANAGFFSLDSLLTVLPTGILHARQTAEELFSKFVPSAPQAVEEDLARQAFALVKALDRESNARSVSTLTVFRWYCVEGLSADDVAAKCRCAKGTVMNRLAAIEKATGTKPDKLRAYSTQFQEIEESLSDSRARRIHREAAIDPDDE